MTVYAVFSGEYSDRCLMGIFSTKENAQAFIDTARLSDHGIDDEPIEYELDKLKPIDKIIVAIDSDGKPSIPDRFEVFYAYSDFDDMGVCDTTYGEYYVEVNYNPDRQVMYKSAFDKLASWKARKEL